MQLKTENRPKGDFKLIQIQGIERVDLTHRIDDVRQRIAAIENRFGIGGDFQTTLEQEIARQEAKVQPTQKVAEVQKMPGTTQAVNAAEIENAAKVAAAIKSAENNSSTTEKVVEQKNSAEDNNSTKNYLPGEEALPGNLKNKIQINPAEENPSVAISPNVRATDDEVPERDDDVIAEEFDAEVSEGTTEEMLLSSATRHGVDPRLVKAIAIAESNMNQDEISEVGAIGVMQLMPETAESLGVNPYDEAENIEGGAMYLKQMLDTFDGNVPYAVAAYNAGPGAVQRYGGVPPYGETQAYVGRVMDMYVG